MTGNYFYKDRSGGQNGPVSLEELVMLAKMGRIAPDCLVWAEGGQPTQAATIPALAAAFQNPLSPAAASGSGPLMTSLPVWDLFWRGIVFVLGVALIVPAPWIGKWFYGWIADRIALPNGRRLFLETTLGECWYIFAGMGLAEALPRLVADPHDKVWAVAIVVLVSELLGFLLIGWFTRSLRSQDGALNVAFEGSLLGYIGWSLLIAFALVTIIGWAWVIKYRMRWICRWTRGSHSFEFVASGWSILWRTLATVFGSALIVTIPWLMRWFYGWYISQIVVTPDASSLVNAERLAA